MTANMSSHWKRVVAEFLAIFAGVVLGLLADDWRGTRQDKERESFALEEILADLQGDSAELASVERRARLWDTAGLWVAKHRGVSLSPDSAVKAVRPLAFYTVYRPQRAAYVGLRDAAELDLIRDQVLRRQIVDYFETQQPYIESLYGDTSELYWEVTVSSRRSFSVTVPPDAESLRDRVSWELLRPWAEASNDQQFAGAAITLGVAGATVALRTPSVREANAALSAAIAQYLR